MATEDLIEETTSPKASATSVDCVVAIGASAGGLRSLEKFFQSMPHDSGLAFVVIQHLSPDFKSVMDEILGRYTDMRVKMIADQMTLEANTVFLIPPSTQITLNDQAFEVTKADRQQIQHPIDVFFVSLAAGFGSRAVGVVLSGTGSDGAEGIATLHEVGGLTIAESPESAQFDGMPKSAIASESVNFILQPEEIAYLLARHADNPNARTSPSDVISHEKLSGINLIFSLLCERHGIDFAHYKPTTVARRIDRRLQMTRKTSIQSYADLLQSDTSELDLLYHDLLIGVTKFFRDTEAFIALDSQLNKVVAKLDDGEELRIWVAGCATGEEAYSIGMMALEALRRFERPESLKVFTTDVHQGALDHAARGVYTAESLEFVSANRKKAFFDTLENGTFRVSADLRRHFVFARHNVIHDPPFTKLSLVTCRNLLIYLQGKAQASAIASFHFSLKQDGLMFLGSSESPGVHHNEFESVVPAWKIYRKLRSLPTLIAETNDLAESIQRGPRRLVNMLNRDKPSSLSFSSLIDAYDSVLRHFVDSGVLLDESRNLVHIFGDAHRFLCNASGRLSGNILGLLDESVRTTIGAALIRAAQDYGVRFELSQLMLQMSDGDAPVDLAITALRGNSANNSFWFLEFARSSEEAEVEERVVRIDQKGEDFSALETELKFTKESLSATIEELEASNEELQAANEQLVASNEELQSTNQELHSVNEELYSVNAENQRKIGELEEMTNDVENLLANTDVGTIFVDANLCIRKFTRASTRLFSLLDHDIGRPLGTFTNHLQMPDFMERVEEVISKGDPFATDVRDAFGNWILVKIVPYRSSAELQGAIINLVNLTATLASATRHDQIIVDDEHGFWEWEDVQSDEMWWSQTHYEILQLERSSTSSSLSAWKALTHPEDTARLSELRDGSADLQGGVQLRMRRQDGEYSQVALHGVVKFDEEGRPTEMRGVISRER